jgi:hypothetical protein
MQSVQALSQPVVLVPLDFDPVGLWAAGIVKQSFLQSLGAEPLPTSPIVLAIYIVQTEHVLVSAILHFSDGAQSHVSVEGLSSRSALCPPLSPFVIAAGSVVRARTHFCLKSVAGHFVLGTAVRVIQ